MSFFGDLFDSDNIGNTIIAGGTGALAGFMAGGPAGAAIGAGLGIASAGQQARAQRKEAAAIDTAQKQADADARARRNELIEKNFRDRKRGAGATKLKSSGQQNASTQGTVLTSSSPSASGGVSILGGGQ